MRKTIGLILAVLSITFQLQAQQVDLSLAEKYSGDALNAYYQNPAVYPNWAEKGSRFYYTSKTPEGVKYFLVDPAKKSKELIFDSQKLASKLTLFTKQVHDEVDLGISGFMLDADNKDLVTFSSKGKRFSYHIRTKELREIEKERSSRPAYRSSEPFWKKFSPDSTYFVYGYRHDLYLQRSGEDTATRLTIDGEPFYSYIQPNASSVDEKRYSPLVYWLKDSKKIVSVREDKRLVGEMTIVNSLAQPRPTVSTYKFPMPGDKHVVQYELHVFDAETRQGKKIDIAKYPDQKVILQSTLVNGKLVLHAPGINDSEQYVYFIRKSRANDQMDLCRLDVRTGQVKELISETSQPHFNDQLFTCRILNNGEILWWSERTGYGQYYLYDRDGKLKNPVTRGLFVAGDVHTFDPKGRFLIFEGYGREKGINPYYRHYYKVNLDGTGLTLLTPGDGYHEISLSKDSKYLVDIYSRMDTAPVSVLRSLTGKKILELERGDLSRLEETGWKRPRLVTVKAADGVTDLYGVMYTPFDLDSTRKYPVITNVYPGPQDDFVPRRFIIDDNYNQSLAQLGFVVLNIGYRGSSPIRGKAFHSFGYGNLRDYALEDDRFAIEQLAQRHPYMDLSRVGIYGHSGGGFMAAAAILSYPDFYKVAVSASGNHDTNIYTQWWGETYHGVQMKQQQVGDSTVYTFESKVPTNMELAANLRGKLLLITGDVDRNVHPASTLRLADALIKADKRFDMMVLPGKDHGLGGRYYTNLIRYYFAEHLLGHKADQSVGVSHR